MASAVISYIGEPVTAAGFALLGAHIQTPALDAQIIWPALQAARQNSDLVILNQAHADTLTTRLVTLLRNEPLPPVLILPGMDREETLSSMEILAARRALGLAQASDAKQGQP